MWLETLLYAVGKCGGTASYAIIYLYTVELFPTPVRSATLGVASMLSRIGAILSPFVAYLVRVLNCLIINVTLSATSKLLGNFLSFPLQPNSVPCDLA